jgi:6-phosphogluconolactonase (cycloisomerase 2 family)
VANNNDNTVSQYTVGADGSLSPMSPATVVTGTTPRFITVDPTGSYAYVANINGNTVSQYAISTGGALVPMSSPTVATGPYPIAVATTD